MHRREFIRTSFAAGLAPLTVPLARLRFTPRHATATAPLRLFLDADTANEIDDLYAIVRALLEPQFDLVALSSAQWNNRLSPPDTVLRSQALNEDLLRLLGRHDVPTPLGGEMIMGKPWGGDEPSDSPAAQLMIKFARETPEGEKLVIASLGPVTNVASAIKLAPDILPKISVYALSGHFHADRRVWNKDEFNLRNDLNAANFLFNTQGLDLHVMPVNILFDFRFDLEDVRTRLGGRGPLWDYLVTRWLSHAPEGQSWIMWDLALVIALARPELATKGRYLTPPENVQREINVYTAVDLEGMKQDWWRVVDAAQTQALQR